jgi:hypothetical protein
MVDREPGGIQTFREPGGLAVGAVDGIVSGKRVRTVMVNRGDGDWFPPKADIDRVRELFFGGAEVSAEPKKVGNARMLHLAHCPEWTPELRAKLAAETEKVVEGLEGAGRARTEARQSFVRLPTPPGWKRTELELLDDQVIYQKGPLNVIVSEVTEDGERKRVASVSHMSGKQAPHADVERVRDIFLPDSVCEGPTIADVMPAVMVDKTMVYLSRRLRVQPAGSGN